MARLVSQGAPSVTSEVVGTSVDSAVVRYSQDRSAYVGSDDLDQSPLRYAVSYEHGGRREYVLHDGTTGVLVGLPSWHGGDTFEVGVDARGVLTNAPLGYLADSSTRGRLDLVGIRPDVLMLDPTKHPQLTDGTNAKSIFEFVSGSRLWTVAYDDAASRGGHLATVNSERDHVLVLDAAAGRRAWIGLTDVHREGTWVWLEPGFEPVTVWKFASGEPNNQGDEDFVHVNHFPGQWNDTANNGTNVGYILERPAVEDFHDYTAPWTSKSRNIEDLRLVLNFQWVTNTEGIYEEVPVMTLADSRVAITEMVPATNWATQPVIEQQSYLKPVRVTPPVRNLQAAEFSGEALRSDQAIVIDVGSDIAITGLVRAKNAVGTTGAIVISAGGDFLMNGAFVPDASDETLPAIAGITAVNSVIINTGGSFTLAPSININVDDAAVTDSPENRIVITTGESAIIRGTLSTTNTTLGEVTVNAADDIELKGEIVSGHVVNIAAGRDGFGGISSDIFGNIRTLGSEVNLSAGAQGGNITLTDLFIETAGPLSIEAPAGSIANTGGVLTAGSVSATAEDGISLVVEADNLSAEVTGDGGLNLFGFGTLTIDNASTANGAISVSGTGNMTVGNVTASGSEGSVSIQPLGNAAANMTGQISTSGKIILRVEGGETIVTEANELDVIVTTPGDVTIQRSATTPFTLTATVLDGSLAVSTGGDLLLGKIELQSNRADHAINLNAGGDVVFEQIVAGEFFASEAEATAVREARGLDADALFTSLADVSIQAGGAIRLATTDGRADIIAGRLTLIAQSGIDSMSLAVNELAQVTTAIGDILLTDVDGAGERSQGLKVVEVEATAGRVEITAAGSLLVTSVRAGGELSPVRLVAEDGSLELRDSDSVNTAIHATGNLELVSKFDMLLAGDVVAAGDVSLQSEGGLRSLDPQFQLETSGAVTIEAVDAIVLSGKLTASSSLAIESTEGDIAIRSEISSYAGTQFQQMTIAAGGNLNLAGSQLAPVTNSMTITATSSFSTGLEPVDFVVTGVDGQLSIEVGGDLSISPKSTVQADSIRLASNGYQLENGDWVGGNVAVLAVPQGAGTAAPKQLTLKAKEHLHLHDFVTASEVLRIESGTVHLAPLQRLLPFAGDFLATGGGSQQLLDALTGNAATVTAPHIQLAGGVVLVLDSGLAGLDRFVSSQPIELLDGAIGLQTQGPDVVLWSAPLAGSGGITKLGAGTLELRGEHQYTGQTLIESGTLVLVGSLATESDILVRGGTLTATGDRSNAVVVADGGVLTIGNSVDRFGALTLGSQSLNAGSNLVIDASAEELDTLAVTGLLQIDPQATIRVQGLNDYVLPVSSGIVLISNDGSDAIAGQRARFVGTNDAGVRFHGDLMLNGGDGNDLSIVTGMDFGDAPSQAQSGRDHDYPVNAFADGARHFVVGPRLGNNVTLKANGVPSSDASSDNDDGLVKISTLGRAPLRNNSATLTVNLQQADALSNKLDAWIDWNRDGDWNDPGEQILVSADLGVVDGEKTLSFTIPAGIELGQTFLRLRLSTAGGLSPSGLAVDGEVEDYAVEVVEPQLSLTFDHQAISEAGGAATATVTRAGDLSQALVVNLSHNDISEVSMPTSVTIPAGSDTATFTVRAVMDSLFDPNRIVTIAASAIGYERVSKTIEVTNVDQPLLVVLASKSQINEASQFELTIVHNLETQAPMTVMLQGDATEVLLPESVTIPANRDRVRFTAQTLADHRVDGNQLVTILAAVDGFTTGTTLLTVIDLDTPTLNLSVTPGDISENGGVAVATLTRNTSTENALLVSLFSSDTSEAVVAKSVVIPAGSDSVTFEIYGQDDAIVDGNQSVTILASSFGFADASVIVRVADDDVAGIVSLERIQHARETGPTAGKFLVSMTAASSEDTVITYVISGTADASDYQALPATIVIPAGSLSTEVSIVPVDDQLAEDTETVVLTLLEVTSGTALLPKSVTAELTIQDNDRDLTPPVARVNALPTTASSLLIPITVTLEDPAGSDGEYVSGVASYDLYWDRDQEGDWRLWAGNVPATQATVMFEAESHHQYWFRAVATDAAGNREVEANPNSEAKIRTGDLSAPVTDLITVSDPVDGKFTLQLGGVDVGQSGMREFRVFVSVDGGEATEIAGSPVLAGTADGSGRYHGVTEYLGIQDGQLHEYRFFVRGVDNASNMELVPPPERHMTKSAIIAPAGALTAVGIDVSKGQIQRSFVRFVDVSFSTDAGLAELISNGRVRVDRYAVDDADLTNPTRVSPTALKVVGNKIEIDFGANGLGGNRNTVAGNGFYRISLDLNGDGLFTDAMFEFHRLLGDANGDGVVDSADTAFNNTARQDLNGDGRFNILDSRAITTGDREKDLANKLIDMLDD